jgi:hypothetical protein
MARWCQNGSAAAAGSVRIRRPEDGSETMVEHFSGHLSI